jgi:hypothetical protein
MTANMHKAGKYDCIYLFTLYECNLSHIYNLKNYYSKPLCHTYYAYKSAYIHINMNINFYLLDTANLEGIFLLGIGIFVKDS